MQNKWKSAAALAASAGLALTGVLASAGAASAATTTSTVPYVCQTRYQGEWLPVPDYTRDFTVTAPGTVAPGQTFKITFDSAPINAVPTYNKTLTDVRIAYRVPAGATVVGHRLTGGSNLGGATQWVERDGNEFVLRTDGKFAGGVEFDLPNLEVQLKAPASGTLTTGPGGSSFEDPSFYWYRLQPTTNEWDPFQCYADPARPVTFSTTRVQG